MSRHRRKPSQIIQERRRSVAQGLASRSSRNRLVQKGIVLNLSENELRIRDLETEVAALKGELEQQAANNSREHREQMSQAEKTAQEANLEFASQARNIHVTREKHLKEKKDLEGKLSRSLLDQIKKRSGKFYDDVSAALQATMADEAAIRARELEKELEEIELKLQTASEEHRRSLEAQKTALLAKHSTEMDAARNQYDRRLEARLAQLAENHDAEMRRHDLEASKQHSDDLDRVQRDWAKRWSDRERECLEKESQRDATRQEELDTAKADFKSQQAEAERRHHQELRERDRRDMALLQEKLDELSRAREELERDRITYEKESAEKYSKSLDQAKEQDRLSRAEMENLRQREVEALELSIKEERKMYIDSREQMELAHVREITSLRSLVEDERKRGSEKSTRFEDELERKFAMLAEGLEQQAREYHKHRLERALGGLEHRAMSEVDKTRVRNDAMLDAEERMNARFQKMVTELRDSWNQEEQARASAADERLRAHFETVLEHAHEQLQMALQLNDSVDKRWMEDVQRRNKQTLEGMKQFQAKCQRLYEERLKDYVTSTELQLRRYESQLLEAGATAASEKGVLRSKIRRIKIACQRWRVDYQRMIEKRYDETVEAVEERYLAEIRALQQELITLRKKDGETKLELNTQARVEQEMRTAEILKRRDEELEEQRREREQAKNTASLQHHREQLAKVWSAMQTDPIDKIDFLTQVFEIAPYSNALLAHLQSYSTRLAAQLPLLQQVTRREFIKYRLKCIHRFQQDPAKRQEFAQGTEGARTRDLLMSELGGLNAKLQADLQVRFFLCLACFFFFFYLLLLFLLLLLLLLLC